MTSRHVVTIQLVNPEYVLAVGPRRAIYLNAYADVTIQLRNVEVAKALKEAVRQKVWQLRDIADSPRNSKSLRRQVSKAPRPPYRGNALYRLQTGHPQRETHAALEIEISDAEQIKPGDVGQVLSIDSSEYGHTMLAIRNIPAGLALVNALESVIWEFENDPYGPSSPYAAGQRDRARELARMWAKVRDALYSQTKDKQFLEEDDNQLIWHIKSIIEQGSDHDKAIAYGILRAATAGMDSPPRWILDAF